MFPHIITVWNETNRNNTGGITYQRTTINNVRYENNIVKQSTKEGESNSSTLDLFVFLSVIDCNKQYIDPISFKDLELKADYFTFDTNTIIGLGNIDTLQPSGEYYSIDSIKPTYAMGSEIHHFEIKGS